jgi:very-short-patch-repair endonuclease
MAKVQYNLEEQVDRVFNSMLDSVKGAIRYDALLLSKICESPIEVMLGCSILLHDRIDPFTRGNGIIICGPNEIDSYREDKWLLVPQYNWEGYRIDFAVRASHYRFKWVFIECDGHNFHERTKEQAAKDRQKDRDIQASGFPVLRFTGSEIYRSPDEAGNAFFDFLEQRIDDWIPYMERSSNG